MQWCDVTPKYFRRPLFILVLAGAVVHVFPNFDTSVLIINSYLVLLRWLQ